MLLAAPPESSGCSASGSGTKADKPVAGVQLYDTVRLADEPAY